MGTSFHDLRTRSAYSEGAGIYRILPAAVTIPRNTDEVVQLVRDSERRGAPLIPRGAGSGMPGGNIGRGTIVDCSRGFRALEVDPVRRIARAGAGVTWAEVNDAARPHGLRLPPDPSSGAFATSGGMVATNASGPRTVRYGSVRRWVESIEIVGADGAVRSVRRGGGAGPWHLSLDTRRLVEERFPRTGKNSSGYALDAFAASGDELDLFIGAEGTLGFVTAVEWRLDPIPPAAAGAALALDGPDSLGAAASYLVTLDPSAVELLDRTLLDFVVAGGGEVPPGTDALLLVEFERETEAAARGAVGDAVRGLKDLILQAETAIDRAGLERLWGVRRLASPVLARLPETRRSLQVVEDGCVPLVGLAEYVAGLRAAAARHEIPVAMFGHAGDGHVHVNALPDLSAAGWREALHALYADVLDLLRDLGGTPSGEHGDGRLRAGVLERFFGPELMSRFRDLKAVYDPKSIFNPGVILPAPDWTPLADLKVGDDAARIPADIATRLRALERNAAWSTPKLELTRQP
ncbi:MAG TPA: FAD-binding oxidoreductase [Gemmatimonadales bacterium]|nr:FAD-binding oxidoreductase [Gemmatimonadales bacterium]